ncbi:hypothetical protein M409DRAFT_24124 [Zasmidium cellare ATCC 36951]|uniref:Protein kinase domain-containing protein n=1 Tax=Zasmidium cellare ATCC 36951 TaxID=1080233 RepID=A0A6A6CF27_ZASCE|nr:uncharacterized protein M409DRAFT_24124 [Zasmidium cellare ATCC 36951]KAF2165837.1 hypothetical protein M409DRAFT_24124 [Zasmidium cellare ATCC 36951]
MLTFLRSLLPTAPDEDYDSTRITSDLEQGPDPDPIAPIGYELTRGKHSTAVPWSASPNAEGKRGYAGWFEKFEGVVHRDGTSVLVFPSHFMYENPITGEVVIYEWLFERGDRVRSHPRIVHWLGRTNTGFSLQRLRPGPMHFEKQRGDGEFLRLYWSWAMQVLNAMSFLHGRGVRLGSFSEDILWIREDFSIAVACLIGAGCERERVAVGGFDVPITSPWHDESFEAPEPGVDVTDWWDRRISGHVKADLVDWANIVFRWMAGVDEEILRFHEDPDKPAPEVKDSVSRRWWEAYRYRGELVGFRRLEKRLLGNVIVGVLMGKYGSAGEVLEQVRRTIGEGGGVVCGEMGDEVSGEGRIEEGFEVVQGEGGGSHELRLRRTDLQDNDLG